MFWLWVFYEHFLSIQAVILSRFFFFNIEIFGGFGFIFTSLEIQLLRNNSSGVFIVTVFFCDCVYVCGIF